jgi:flagellin-specific chaperone FliS
LLGDRYKNARLNAKSPEEQIKMLVQAGYSTMNSTTYVNLMKGNISRVRKLLPFGRIE